MSRIISLIILFLFTYSVPLSSQENKDPLVSQIEFIKQHQGDLTARNYLESKRDSLEKEGETSIYILLWGLLTSNMWSSNPTDSLKIEYKQYLDTIIDDEIKSKEYTPDFDLLSPLWRLTTDYYNIIYGEGDKETALLLLTNIHRWFEPYFEARNTPGYANSLFDLCLILVRDMHKYKEGEPFCREYAEVSKSVFGENSAEYAMALYNITVLPQTSAEEKTDKLEKALEIYEHANNHDDGMLQQMRNEYEMQIAIMTGISNTAEINGDDFLSLEDCTKLVVSGRGEKAIGSLLKYKENLWRETHLDTLRYTSVITILIDAYIQMGNLVAADKEIESFNNSIGISTDIIPTEYVQIFYSNAGIIAYRLKDYTKALRLSFAACNLYEKSGNFGMEYAKVLANICGIYAELGQNLDSNYFLDAKWYIDEAISVFEEHVGSLKQHGNIGIMLLSNKALVYDAIGDTQEAINALEDIVKNFSDNIDSIDAWVMAANNLATMYMKQGRWAEGANLLERLKSNNDETNYLFISNLLLCRMFLNDNKKTADTLHALNLYSMNNITHVFSYFADFERENYWSQISGERIFINNLVANHTNDDNVLSIAYDNALFCKKLTLVCSLLIDRSFNKLTDETIKHDYQTYKDLKAKFNFKTEDQSDKNVLKQKLTKLEKRLIEYFPNIGDLINNGSISWKEVQKSLGEDEIAIEYCYIPQMEKYPDLQMYYGAFILQKGFNYPKLITLVNEDDVEDLFYERDVDELFINDLYSSTKAKNLYEMLWQKLVPYLDGIKTVYYSPTGPLANLNFDVLRGEDGKMLNEKYKMVRVSSTANICEMKVKEKEQFHSSVLYGNIKYDESTSEMEKASSAYNEFSGIEIQPELAYRSENERGKWGPIPATETEINDIGKLLSQKKIMVIKYEENAANEESFKALSGKSPDIIHLATHGFVIDTPQRAEQNKFVATTNFYSQKESYMLWAGLMLAGGNNVWQGNFNLSNVEDGILTADEISRLDLSNTKLVVLSACETAKGKIDPVDGVYGLQRAFKMAGVQTIVMSLWKVQDDATSLLMTQFYTYLTDGVERHQALWKAMMDVREKYPDPYYWAGFIMLD